MRSMCRVHMRRRRLLRSVGTGLTGAACLGLAGGSPDTISGSLGDEYWLGYHYKKYVPNSAVPSEETPLLVMLHGCAQEPAEFARATEMNALADSEGFAVIYPDQSSFANPWDCWTWFYDFHTERGTGEGWDITEMARNEAREEGLDRSRIYAVGFSAGAAMVPNLLVSYADVYAAGGIHSGLEYDAADTAAQATIALDNGGPDPTVQGQNTYKAMQSNEIVNPVPTIVIHGAVDDTVRPINGEQATKQAIVTNDLATDDDVDSTPDETTNGSTGGYEWQRDRYAGADGNQTYVERWKIDGMGHSWAGGSADSDFTAPNGPNASEAIWNYVSQWSLA